MKYFCFIFLLISCNNTSDVRSFLDDYEPINAQGSINAVVEISSGTLEKWEVDKKSGKIERDIENGRHRKINYLGYPSNYGMIPRTQLPKELGGDGDPLDVLILGEPIPRGSVVQVKLIGVMNMLDDGERDDKLIAVLTDKTIFSNIDNIEEFDRLFPGSLLIIRTWFANYKGGNRISFIGFGEKDIAEKILFDAIENYEDKR